MRIGRKLAIKILNVSRFVLRAAGDLSGVPAVGRVAATLAGTGRLPAAAATAAAAIGGRRRAPGGAARHYRLAGAGVRDPAERPGPSDPSRSTPPSWPALSRADRGGHRGLRAVRLRPGPGADRERSSGRSATTTWNSSRAGPTGRSARNEPDRPAPPCCTRCRCYYDCLRRSLPYVTEEVWSWWHEAARYTGPSGRRSAELGATDGDAGLWHAASELLGAVRKEKTAAGVSLRAPVAVVQVTAPDDRLVMLQAAADDLREAGTIADLKWSSGDEPMGWTSRSSWRGRDAGGRGAGRGRAAIRIPLLRARTEGTTPGPGGKRGSGLLSRPASRARTRPCLAATDSTAAKPGPKGALFGPVPLHTSRPPPSSPRSRDTFRPRWLPPRRRPPPEADSHRRQRRRRRQMAAPPVATPHASCRAR